MSPFYYAPLKKCIIKDGKYIIRAKTNLIDKMSDESLNFISTIKPDVADVVALSILDSGLNATDVSFTEGMIFISVGEEILIKLDECYNIRYLISNYRVKSFSSPDLVKYTIKFINEHTNQNLVWT